jgi:hypothetical protein
VINTSNDQKIQGIFPAEFEPCWIKNWGHTGTGLLMGFPLLLFVIHLKLLLNLTSLKGKMANESYTCGHAKIRWRVQSNIFYGELIFPQPPLNF